MEEKKKFLKASVARQFECTQQSLDSTNSKRLTESMDKVSRLSDQEQKFSL